MADQKREIWVHRISHHYTVAKPLLDEQGFLTIGYADLNDPRSDFLKKNQFKDFSSFNAFIKTTKHYNASRFSLHRVLALIKPGGLGGAGACTPHRAHQTISRSGFHQDNETL